jgi:MFS family permease
VSRAEHRVVPPPPRLGAVIREAASDFYFNGWRFFGGNLVFGAVLLAILWLSVVSPWLLLALALLALPAAGIMRMATRVERIGHTDFDDFIQVTRHPGRVFVIGGLQAIVTAVLAVDLLIGLSWGSWPGTLLFVSALYGIGVLWCYAAVAWPILLDPERDGEPVRGLLRLGLVVLLVHPIRLGGLALLAGLLLVIATVLIAPILTFAVSLVWLAIAGYVLPLADRIEGRRTRVVDAP